MDSSLLRRGARFLPVIACGSLLACAGSEYSRWFRRAEPRADTTLFTALDLPTPSDVRTAAGAPGPKYWQQRADYAIEATLDAETRLLSGHAHVTYRNQSPHVLDYLWVNLEQNSFREDSLGVASVSANPQGLRRNPDTRFEGDGCTIHSLRCADGDLAHAVYDTEMRVDLPRPLPPGERFEFDVAWSFTVPEKLARRFGIEKCEQGVVFEIAQWFPQVAVYDDVHGWNTLPYLGSAEFYSNFGDYDVKLTVPREHLVVATGVLQNPDAVYTAEQRERLARAKDSAETVIVRGADEVGSAQSRPAGEGPLTWHFKAENVRTFAFATSAAFILDAAGQDGVLLQSAYPKEGLPLWGKSTQMLRKAIEGYSRRWFRYPYPVATNVNGIEGGMEYPMIVFCRARSDEHALYGVTSHEIGHTWFPMVVNTDERRHAWMDEGFNTFINHYSDEDWFGAGADRRADRAHPARFAPSMLQPDLLPVDTPPDALPRFLISNLQYSKTGAGLVLLREQILGPERFDVAFREYIRRWAFKSPQPADFYRSMEDAAGADLDWFFRGWFHETGWLDQAVGDVEQAQPAQNGPAIVSAAKPAQVWIDNFGELVMPAVVTITFHDGSTLVRRIPVQAFASSNRYTFTVETDQRIASVVVDAAQDFPDVRRDNNTWIAPHWTR